MGNRSSAPASAHGDDPQTVRVKGPSLYAWQASVNEYHGDGKNLFRQPDTEDEQNKHDVCPIWGQYSEPQDYLTKLLNDKGLDITQDVNYTRREHVRKYLKIDHDHADDVETSKSWSELYRLYLPMSLHIHLSNQLRMMQKNEVYKCNNANNWSSKIAHEMKFLRKAQLKKFTELSDETLEDLLNTMIPCMGNISAKWKELKDNNADITGTSLSDSDTQVFESLAEHMVEAMNKRRIEIFEVPSAKWKEGEEVEAYHKLEGRMSNHKHWYTCYIERRNADDTFDVKFRDWRMDLPNELRIDLWRNKEKSVNERVQRKLEVLRKRIRVENLRKKAKNVPECIAFAKDRHGFPRGSVRTGCRDWGIDRIEPDSGSNSRRRLSSTSTERVLSCITQLF